MKTLSNFEKIDDLVLNLLRSTYYVLAQGFASKMLKKGHSNSQQLSRATLG